MEILPIKMHVKDSWMDNGDSVTNAFCNKFRIINRDQSQTPPPTFTDLLNVLVVICVILHGPPFLVRTVVGVWA